MRTHPQHHDGVGTDASLHAFMHSLGHEQSATPAVALPPARVPSYRPASRDVGRTVRRLRARGITPLQVITPPVPDERFAKGLMIATPIVMFLWIIISLIGAYATGRI